MSLYKGSNLGIFWWVCDLVLGGGFVIWFWMGVICGGFAGGGDGEGFFLLVVVVVWVVGFWWVVLVWCYEKEREKGERGKIKNY